MYVAAPYTQNDQARNVRYAIDVAEIVVASGHYPFVPHLFHFWHMIHSHNYQEWLMLAAQWIPVCDVMLARRGNSTGVPFEMHRAEGHGLKVYTDIKEFIREQARGDRATKVARRLGFDIGDGED